jgi:hypothetical protein
MPITPKTRRAQARHRPACCYRSGHPDPIIGLSVFDGTTPAVTATLHTFVAINGDERLIGSFHGRREALRVAPGRHA